MRRWLKRRSSWASWPSLSTPAKLFSSESSSPTLQVRARSSDSCRQTPGEFVRLGTGLKSLRPLTHLRSRAQAQVRLTMRSCSTSASYQSARSWVSWRTPAKTRATSSGNWEWVFTPPSWWRAKSRCSRRLTTPRKVRRAVLRTSRMLRSGSEFRRQKLVEQSGQETESSPPSPSQSSPARSLLDSPSTCSATLSIWYYVLVLGGSRSLRFEEFRREEFKTSSPVAAYPS